MKTATKRLLALLAIFIMWAGLMILAGKAFSSEVLEFKDWYGIWDFGIDVPPGKALAGFSNSDDAQIAVFVDEQLIVTIKVYGKSDLVSNVSVSVDGKEATTILDYRLARQFKRGYKATVWFTNANGVKQTEVFSLRGFLKGYRWLLEE